MKWYKKLALAGLATLAVVGLAACQKKDQSADGKVTIEYFNQKTEMTATLQEMVKDFEKENPNIHVKLTTVPSAGIVLKTRILSGDVPDVVNVYPQSIELQ